MNFHFGTITHHLGHHGSLHEPPASARCNRLDTAAAMFSIQIHLKSWAQNQSTSKLSLLKLHISVFPILTHTQKYIQS